jgi:hypothetical protein
MMTPENFRFANIIPELQAMDYKYWHFKEFCQLFKTSSVKEAQRLFENLDSGKSKQPESYKEQLKQAYFNFLEHKKNEPEKLNWLHIREFCYSRGITGKDFTVITGIQFRYDARRSRMGFLPEVEERIRKFFKEYENVPPEHVVSRIQLNDCEPVEMVNATTRRNNFNKLQKWVNE